MSDPSTGKAADRISEFVHDGLLEMEHAIRFINLFNDPSWSIDDIMAACSAHIQQGYHQKRSTSSPTINDSHVIKRQRHRRSLSPDSKRPIK